MTETKKKKKAPTRTQEDLVAAAQDTFTFLEPKPFRPSGSTLKNVAICPSWRPLPEDPRDPKTAAEEGTAFALALETGKTDKLNVEQLHFLKMAENYRTPLIEGALYYAKEARFIRDGHLPGGKADMLAFQAEGDLVHAHVVDEKYGMVAVDDAEHNWQGWCYAIHAWRYRSPSVLRVDKVTVHFVQPRLDQLSTHTFYPDALAAIFERIQAVDQAVQLPDAHRPRVLKLTNCHYCGDLKCPVMVEKATQLAKYYQSVHDDIPHIRPSECSDAGTWAVLLDSKGVLSKWGESVGHGATQFRLGGHEIPGYRIADRKGSRSIDSTVTESVYQRVLEKYAAAKLEMKLSRFMELTTISVSDMQEALAQDLGANEAEAFLYELMDAGLVRQNATSYFMKRDSR